MITSLRELLWGANKQCIRKSCVDCRALWKWCKYTENLLVAGLAVFAECNRFNRNNLITERILFWRSEARLARARYRNNSCNLYNKKMRVWEARLAFVKCLSASHMNCTALNLHADCTHCLCHDHLPAATAGRAGKSKCHKIFLVFYIRRQNWASGKRNEELL